MFGKQRPTARRSAAAWLRQRVMGRYLGLLIPTCVGGGVLVGALLVPWLPQLHWAVGAAVVVVGGFWLLYGRRSLSNLEKGLDAEYRIGQVIEYALVPRECAVAHGVTEIAAVGDIDHLVGVRRGLWVIETKVRAVPQERFPAVLDRIAANVHAVEAWAGDVPVHGCLALLVPFRGKRDYEAADGTPVVVHDEQSLRDMLRAEAGEDGPVGRELARRVWELGRVVD